MSNSIKGFRFNGNTYKYDYTALDNAPNVETDKTLAITNRPADAKVVGDEIASIRNAVGTPLTAETASGMTDTNKIYVYTGSETGYTNGNWYYFDTSQNKWVSGGTYNSAVINTDDTLTQSGEAADAKAVGDEVTNLKSALNYNLKSIVGKSNLLFGIETTKGYYINDAGEFVKDANYSYTSEIDVSPEAYTLITDGDLSTIRVHGYKNGVWVKQVASVTELNATFTVSSDVDTIRISYRSTGKALVALLEGKSCVDMIGDVDQRVENDEHLLDIVCCIQEGYVIPQSAIINGGYNTNGSYAANGSQLRYIVNIPANGIYKIKFTPGTNVKRFRYAYKTKTSSTFAASSWYTEETSIYLNNIESIILLFRNESQTTISPNEYDATTVLSPSMRKTIALHLETGAYSSATYYGGMPQFRTNVINQFPIVVKNVKKLQFDGLPDESRVISIILYASDGTRIRYDNYTITNLSVVTLPNVSFDHIGISMPRFDFWNYNINISAIGPIDEAFEIYETKRIFTNSGNQLIKYFMVDEQELLYSAMTYMLPPNYTNNGAKTPIILWFDGNTNYSAMGDGFSEGKLPGLRYLRDEGYAIVQIYSWGSYYSNKYPRCGLDQPYPIATNLRILKEGLDYFTSRYNVDGSDIHVVSKSVGGIISLFFASNPIYPFKSISMFAPVLDFLSMRGRYSDAKKAIAEELDLQGDLESFYDADFHYFTEDGEAFWELNKDKLLRLNPAWVNLIGSGLSSQFDSSFTDARTWWGNKSSTDIYTHDDYKKIACVPVKIWGSADDTDTPYPIMPEVVKQLQNAGNFAEMRTIPNGWGAHSSADIAGTYNTVDSITTALGITHTNVAIGWAEAIKWIRLNSMKL